MTVIKEKEILRKKMSAQREKLDPTLKKAYDIDICKQLEQIIIQRNYKIIHAYLPIGKEIDINPLLEKLIARQLTVITPKVLPKRQLEHRVLKTVSAIEKGPFGTKHPSNPIKYNGTFDLIIIPGLAYDIHNYRLGYGGGYYDSFLANHPNSDKVGIFYSNQKVEWLPIEAHDIRLDKILINS